MQLCIRPLNDRACFHLVLAQVKEVICIEPKSLNDNHGPIEKYTHTRVMVNIFSLSE